MSSYPLGSPGSQREIQITKGEESAQQEHGRLQQTSASSTGYNEVTFDTLYEVTSPFVLNPLFSQQKTEGGLTTSSY